MIKMGNGYKPGNFFNNILKLTVFKNLELDVLSKNVII